jgi:hemoglobin
MVDVGGPGLFPPRAALGDSSSSSIPNSKDRAMRNDRFLKVALGFLAASACAPTIVETPPPAVAAQPQPEPQPPPQQKQRRGSLYERLGGQPAIGAVADEFLKRVAGDARINGRFVNTDLTRLRGLLVDFVCAATGGPCQYQGRDMRSAHAGMKILEEEFNALVEDMVSALVALKVPKAEQNEILAALGPLKTDIVDPPSAEAAAHDPALVKAARAEVASLRASGNSPAADLLSVAISARLHGQRSYAEQVFSAVERQLPPGGLPALDPLFREGAPPRVTTALNTMPKDTAPQPKTSVGSSDQDDPEAKVKRGSLSGEVVFGGGQSGSTLGVIVLEPLSGKSAKRAPKRRVIEQRDRQFAPHLLAVPVGSTVSFPNFDPVFHNVFSLSPVKAFDLGAYRNGETRDVTFEKEGFIRVGCNLHANMSAFLVVVKAPHYVVTDQAGRFKFRSLAPGKYAMRAWAESSTEPVSRTITIAAGDNTVKLELPGRPMVDLGTDKFGVTRGKGL